MSKICQKCSNEFPSWINIDGKNRNLQKRKFCFSCSPFGGKNRKNLVSDIYNDIGKNFTCLQCGKIFAYKEKGNRSKKICASCIVINWRRRLKQRAIDYKGGKCIICGYNKCNGSLVFHHVDHEDKDFSVASGSIRSWKRVKKELDKCVIVCMNCHGELHSKNIVAIENVFQFSETSIGIDHNILRSFEKEFGKELVAKEVGVWIEYLEEKISKAQDTLCPVCGKPKDKKAATCSVECFGVKNRKVDWDKMDEKLIEMVNKKIPWTKIGKHFGISDNSAKKRAMVIGLI